MAWKPIPGRKDSVRWLALILSAHGESDMEISTGQVMKGNCFGVILGPQARNHEHWHTHRHIWHTSLELM